MGKYSPYAITEYESPNWKPGEELAAAAFIGIAISLVVDVNVGIWRVFRKSQGLYYWSMRLGTAGILIDCIGVILKYLTPNPYRLWGLYTAFLCLGWATYAPAQLLVLYSRLHLINANRKTQRWILIMIISTIPLLIIPTWVVVWPAYDPDPKISSLWSPRDAIVERYNQIGFTVAELVISCNYIWCLLGLLNLKSSVRQRRVMTDIIYVNIIILALDLLVVILLYLNQTGLSHPIQTFSYALKLKLEFVVLNQLMAVAVRGVRRTNFEERRYLNTNTTDGFSAECRAWDNKSPGFGTKEYRGSKQNSQGPGHSDSIQITLPSATFNKEDPGGQIQDRTYDWEKRARRGLEKAPEIEPDAYLDMEDEDPDTIRHKSSEAFSGDTLHSPIPRDEPSYNYSPRPNIPRNRPSSRRPMPSSHPSRRQQNDNRPLPSNERKGRLPHIAKMKIRKSIPKNARYVHDDDDDEEEEIGVHMWENRKGSMVLEIPWFRPEDGGRGAG